MSKTHKAKITVTFVKEQNTQVLAQVTTVHRQYAHQDGFCGTTPEFSTASTVQARGESQKFLDA